MENMDDVDSLGTVPYLDARVLVVVASQRFGHPIHLVTLVPYKSLW